MLDWLNNWVGNSFAGAMLSLGLGLLGYAGWRQFRDRARRRYYRQRERERREYWGFD